MAKYILRFDDITLDMDWGNFTKIKRIAEKYKIYSILGVVPENRDPKLSVAKTLSKAEFFSNIKEYVEYGDTIAQHGTFHLYTTKNSGLLKINNKSEFAGHSYAEQLSKLKEGKEILQRHGIWQPYFMAPSHSFDRNTLKALNELGFEAITDGYGFYSYEIEGITLMPQLVSKPIKSIPFGIQTICLHTNNMDLFSIETLIEFIESNSRNFISFEDALKIKANNKHVDEITHHFSKLSLQALRKLKGMIT